MDQEKIGDDEGWLLSQLQDEDEDEALSLSDLPLIHQWRKENKDNDENKHDNDQDDHDHPAREGGEDQEFDFCSRASEMCAADEVFFKGQILPLRHSVSSEKGLLHNYDGRRRSFSISRSDSMDHYYSSRSSSISSHQSSSSGTSSSSTTTTAAAAASYKPKLPPRLQFHSHPSPSPRLHFPSNRHGGAAAANHRNSIKKSSIWNVLRLGLVASPPEIAFHDLKARSGNSGTFGSRHSTSSNSSSGGGEKKKMRPRILGGGCRCVSDAVDTIGPRVVIIKRSASDGDEHDHRSASDGNVEKLTKNQAAKKHLSHHRTFEWLKQLSIEGGGADQS